MTRNLLPVKASHILIWLAFAGSTFAQFNSSIQGTLIDTSGGAVANATVKVKNVLTGVGKDVPSNEAGFYRFASLPPGSYEVTASSSGFQTKTIRVAVSNGQNRGVDFTLTIQNSAESVQVTEEAPLLDTAESREHLTINQATLRELPLSNNSFFSILGITPGVTGANAVSDNFQQAYQSRISANGRSAYGNSFALDGMSTNSNITNGTTNIVINPEAIQ
jgi:hypothetical protein